ncbi:CYTH domain-containing protein [Mesorhizobium zhangyense]|uniref:CYTH domain-containing protein n=1 Tax=Mesorhizobium zhangyense TaxID=1776730 RepID=UPI001FEAE529|nr:CYTH domain-containing protein [Mesorhizobium zhangyense]
MSEIELKFLFDEADARALWARVKALGWADGRPNTQTLRSIYLDTAEHALKKAGIALRLRRDGRRWIQTVKTGRQLHGGLSLSGEVEVAVPEGQLNLDLIPDAALRAEIVRAVGGASLQTICETAIRRTRREFSLENGTRAELAVDIGEILAAGRSAPLCEVEIELLEGDPSGLFDIAQALFPDGGCDFRGFPNRPAAISSMRRATSIRRSRRKKLEQSSWILRGRPSRRRAPRFENVSTR